MINTKIIAAGALVAAGSDASLATKVTLNAATKEYTIEGIVTNGAVPEGTKTLMLQMLFATSNVDGVAATIVTSLALYAELKQVRLKHSASVITYFRSKPFIPTGSLLYVWFNSPVLPADAAIDVWLNEFPEIGGSSTAPAAIIGVEGGVPVGAVGSGLSVKSAPAVTIGAYAAGNSIGGKIVLANAVRVAGGMSRLEGIHLLDRSNTKPSGYILIFDADPAAATLADKTAFVYSTDDLKEIARIDVSTADWVTINGKAVADVPYAGRLLKSAATTSLWAAFIVGPTVPTFAATTDFQMITKFSYAN